MFIAFVVYILIQTKSWEYMGKSSIKGLFFFSPLKSKQFFGFRNYPSRVFSLLTTSSRGWRRSGRGMTMTSSGAIVATSVTNCWGTQMVRRWEKPPWFSSDNDNSLIYGIMYVYIYEHITIQQTSIYNMWGYHLEIIIYTLYIYNVGKAIVHHAPLFQRWWVI